MAGWPAISLGTSSIDDSARIIDSIDVHMWDRSDQVMSFMGGKTARRNYGKTRAAVASVATERFQILLDQAKTMASTNEKLSRRYVSLARKISSRTKVRIPRESKMYLCKGCGIALVPGHNAKIRLHAHTTGIVISCMSCGAVKRYPVNPRNVANKGLAR